MANNRLSVSSGSISLAPSSSNTTSPKQQSPSSSTGESILKEPELNLTSSTNNAHIVTTKLSSTSKASLMVKLSATIARETEKLDRYLKENGLPEPGFDVDSPSNFPNLSDEMKKTRMEIMIATKELGDLVTGPTEIVRWMAWNHNDSLSLKAIYRYKIAKSFPIHSTATFAEIASKVGLDEVNTRRFLRHAMTNRIFREVSPGVIAHTASSRVLAEDTVMEDWVGNGVDELWPSATYTLDAIELHPSASEPTQTGFCFANKTTDRESMFTTYEKDPVRAKRLGRAMASLTGGEGYELSYLFENYDWESLNAKSGTLVDVGGSHGFVCSGLAKLYPNIKFVVQDLPKTINSAPKLEADLADRVTFQIHDFHTEQPIKGADIYFFRWIFHNHSDPYAVNMLKQLIPALKKGAKVLINDHCLPEPGTESLWDEKIIRTMDLVMLSMLNAQERSEGEFKELFEKVDDRFRFLGATRPEGCRMSIVEAVWDGEDYGGEGVTAEEPRVNRSR